MTIYLVSVRLHGGLHDEPGLVDPCESIRLANEAVSEAFLGIGFLLDSKLVMSIAAEANLMARVVQRGEQRVAGFYSGLFC